MKPLIPLRPMLLGTAAAALVLAPFDSDARKPHPTPPPSIAATGSWTDCNVVTTTHSFGSNSILIVSVTKTFTGTVVGSFSGTEYDFVQADGSAVFYGNGTFTGTVNGKTGTFKMNYVGRIGSDDSYDAHWVIHDGTADLTHLVGEGSFDGTAGTPSSACAMPFSGTYQGKLVFGNRSGHP